MTLKNNIFLKTPLPLLPPKKGKKRKRKKRKKKEKKGRKYVTKNRLQKNLNNKYLKEIFTL